MKLLYKTKVRSEFANYVFAQISNINDGWLRLSLHLSVGKDEDKKSIDKYQLKNVIYVSTRKAEPNDLVSSNYLRFFVEPFYSDKNTFSYLSTQWRFTKGSQLDIASLQNFINTEYSDLFRIDIENEEFQLIQLNEVATVYTRVVKPHQLKPAINKIYFGCPGTGKSHQMALDTEGDERFETTFHPEYDYASFVGSYKPKMKGDAITYAFTPQIFTKAYVYAYQNEAVNVVLTIEEINRGNCAMIFGDIFQLLDRDEKGVSKYKVTPDADLATYLEETLGKRFTGKLVLPNNLSIRATMNTSDQSLFPMDSAFKRRWEWAYIPIDLDQAATMFFTVNGKNYSWQSFLKTVNEKIYKVTESEDKQIGTYFVSGETEIKQAAFKNKVMFYLWFDVFKNDLDNRDNIFKDKNGKSFTFSDLFKKEIGDALLESFLEGLKLTA
jgi:hypothetical protein